MAIGPADVRVGEPGLTVFAGTRSATGPSASSIALILQRRSGGMW
jgi:hypothetical protein